MKKIRSFLLENLVVIFFATLCACACVIAKQAPYVVVSDLISRVMRNSIMVLALIIPILAGMGLNFGIVVGAMSAQSALILVTHWRLTGMFAIFVALALCTVISIVCGILLGMLFNKTRGQEMITGMIAGYFGQGIYLLIFLVLFGTVIPFWDDQISISTGVGVKDTIKLIDGMRGALDNVWTLTLDVVLIAAFVAITLFMAYRLWMGKKQEDRPAMIKTAVQWAVCAVVLAVLLLAPPVAEVVVRCKIPAATLIFILLVSVLCQFIINTKLGQDFRSVGSDIHIAEASGIDVNRIRILATVFSTVLASWGQLVFLQNMGTYSTYTAQQNVGTFSIATLLVGGATIDKANVKQAFVGVVLFQLLFLLAPAVGTNLFNDTQVGEYFRTILYNGVIAVALVLHAVNKFKQAPEAEA